MLQVNQIVKFSAPLPDEDKNQVYRVLEINGDRAIIEAANSGLPIPPTQIVLTADLIPVTTQGTLNQKAENLLKVYPIEHDIRNEQKNSRICIICIEKHANYVLIEKVNGDVTRMVNAQNVIALLCKI